MEQKQYSISLHYTVCKAAIFWAPHHEGVWGGGRTGLVPHILNIGPT